MTKEEYTQLENLFNKLCNELGDNPICILNGQVMDGWHIGIYEKGTLFNGKPFGVREVGRNITGASLEDIVKKLKSKEGEEKK